MGMNTLRLRLTLALLGALAAGAAVLLLWQVDVMWGALALAAALLGVLWAAGLGMAPLRRVLRSLESAALSYRDGDFSVSIVTGRDDELGELVRQAQRAGACAA